MIKEETKFDLEDLLQKLIKARCELEKIEDDYYLISSSYEDLDNYLDGNPAKIHTLIEKVQNFLETLI